MTVVEALPWMKFPESAEKALKRLDWLRAESPFAQFPGGLAVLRYDDCRSLMQNRRVVPAIDHIARVAGRGEEGADVLAASLSLTPVQRRNLRRLVAPCLTAAAAEARYDDFRAEAAEVLGSWTPGDDVITTVTTPFAARCLIGVIGIERAEAARFADLAMRWMQVLAIDPQVPIADSIAALAEVRAFVRRELAGGSTAGGLIAHARDSGASVDDAVTAIGALLTAGVETVGLQLASTLWCLRNAEITSRAWQDAQLQSLRHYPAAPATLRIVDEPLELRGLQLVPGTYLLLLPVAAHREELELAERELLTFSVGITHCLGHALSLVEFRAFGDELAAGFGRLTVDALPQWRPLLKSGAWGLRSLRIELEHR